MVKQIVTQRELKEKYLENQSISTTATSEAWGITLLNSIDHGDTFYDRTGNKITMTQLNMRMRCNTNTIGGFASARIIIFVDREPGGATPSQTDVFRGVYQTAMYETYGDTRGRFQILTDRCITFSTDQRMKHLTFFKKLNIPVEYDGTGAGGADLSKNAIYAAIIGNVGNGTNVVTMTFDSRIRFVDG